jgi:hypothetical protein
LIIMRALIAALVAAGCAGPQAIDRVRFHNRAAVWAVNDRKPIARPAERRLLERLYHYDALVHDRVVQATELRHHRRALGVNALDEVPDSTWFTNRIGVRRVSIAELRQGPNRGPGPMARKPWTIVSGKESGVAPGFLIEDGAGDRHLLKFDLARGPETETGAHIIVHRLLWALGYNVPEDRLVWLRRDELVLSGAAEITDGLGKARAMTEADVEATLAIAHIGEDGRIRGLASKLVPGEPLGGIPDRGVRADDPNDLIPHQRRRDLRGLQPIAAWLKHTDIKEGNTLDVWANDPERPGERYVVHYQLDFGKALGVIARVSYWRSDGYARWIDFREMATTAVTLGLRKRPWDGIESPRIRGVGLIRSDRYDPGSFVIRAPWQPFVDADRFDKLWGARLLMRLSPAHIRAAVEEAGYSDPRATPYLTRILIERQRKTARYWFRRVNPLDGFAVSPAAKGHRLCFDDRMVVHGLEPAAILARTRYTAAAHDQGGRPTGWRARRWVSHEGRVCTDGLEPSPSPEGYTIVAIETERPRASYRPILVHLARAPDTGELRIIGIRRQ